MATEVRHKLDVLRKVKNHICVLLKYLDDANRVEDVKVASYRDRVHDYGVNHPTGTLADWTDYQRNHKGEISDFLTLEEPKSELHECIHNMCATVMVELQAEQIASLDKTVEKEVDDVWEEFSKVDLECHAMLEYAPTDR